MNQQLPCVQATLVLQVVSVFYSIPISQLPRTYIPTGTMYNDIPVSLCLYSTPKTLPLIDLDEGFVPAMDSPKTTLFPLECSNYIYIYIYILLLAWISALTFLFVWDVRFLLLSHFHLFCKQKSKNRNRQNNMGNQFRKSK